MLVFVFDPLAIALVIATNQAFAQRKPKQGNVIIGASEDAGYRLHIDPNPTEEKSTIVVTPQPIEYDEIPPHIQEEKERILKEIARVENSGAAHTARGLAINELQNKLKDLENSKTY